MYCKLVLSALLNGRLEALIKETVTDSEFLLSFGIIGDKPTNACSSTSIDTPLYMYFFYSAKLKELKNIVVKLSNHLQG